MYNIRDLVLYGSTGVCKITDIVKRKLPGVCNDQLYYILKPLYSDCVISTPVDTNKVFMRPIITKCEAERLIETIPSIHAEAYHSCGFRQLTEHYEAALKTYDCGDLITLVMSIYTKKQVLEQQKRKFGAVDERFMKRAEDLLFGELAAALEKPKNEVTEYISARVYEEMRRNSNECTS